MSAIAAEPRVEELHRHLRADARMPREIDGAHAAFAQQPHDAVRAGAPPDQLVPRALPLLVVEGEGAGHGRESTRGC